MAATGNEVPLLSQLKQLKDWVVTQISKKLDSPVGGSPEDGDVIAYQSASGSANPTNTYWARPSNLIPLAGAFVDGLMSSDDKVRLDSLSITNGVLGIGSGGTGATTADAARTALNAAKSDHDHGAADIVSGTLPIARGGTGGDNKTDARHGIGMMDLLWTGSMEISGNTVPPAVSITGISNYYVIVVSFSGRAAPCVLSRFGNSNWFYGDSSYTSGNAAETIYSLGICINSTGDPDAVTELRCCSHVISASGAVGEGNFGATVNRIYGVA